MKITIVLFLCVVGCSSLNKTRLPADTEFEVSRGDGGDKSPEEESPDPTSMPSELQMTDYYLAEPGKPVKTLKDVKQKVCSISVLRLPSEQPSITITAKGEFIWDLQKTNSMKPISFSVDLPLVQGSLPFISVGNVTISSGQINYQNGIYTKSFTVAFSGGIETQIHIIMNVSPDLKSIKSLTYEMRQGPIGSKFEDKKTVQKVACENNFTS